VVTQVVGDCMERVCDGMGAVMEQTDSADPPVDNTECTVGQCTNGQPVNAPAVKNTACNDSGGEMCNGQGACVQCNAPTDCGMDSACVKYTCDAGMCPSDANLEAGASCGVNAKCDGKGGCVTCEAPSALLFTSSDTPLMVPNNSNVGATSNLAVAGLGSSIVDVDVNVSLTSDATGDLTLTLVSPKGTMIDLSSNNGGANDNNFVGTMFDDDANSARVTEATFVNNVALLNAIPERNLGLLNGENPNGTWMLVVKDTGALGFTNPTLTSWSLTITAQGGNFALSTSAYPNPAAFAIPDNATASSPIIVSNTLGFITKATVNVNVDHKSAGQLVLSLVTPTNKTIPLSTKNGEVNSFLGTTFNDAAPNLVGCTGAGCVVFPAMGPVAEIIPEGSLSALVGEDPNGTWTLNVADTANGQTGTLNAWTLNLTTALCPLKP
jgi:subtilisin-like proprotein convertase family protein